ncbi:MAG: polyprenyl synthetase family protein [Candidatus Omnitrophica bacterium]|nr:polyprenyl synthetase family protein [Candidatus Omnitrophota bacterium]
MNLEGLLDKVLPPGSVEPKSLHKAMRYSVFSGGKRIRPMILLESAKVCGGKETAALPIACAVEFIHTYSLIHDDLPAMDDDNYRRGKPSCHKAFGEATAILAGDGLLTLAFEIIARNCPPEIAKEAIIQLAQAAGSFGMVGGQEMDLKPGREKDSSRINLLKTAKLFEVSASLGAIVAGAGKKEVRAMADYGRYLGLAFQIADDAADSDGCSWKSGREKASKEAAGFVSKARLALTIFGKKADKLEKIAEEVYAKIPR